MIEFVLKPCPFCGYPAVFEPFKERKGYAATVRCSNCLCEITTITYDTEKEAEMEAVFAWNRRVNESASTIDVVERKKGRWIQTGAGYQCSSCYYKLQTTGMPQLCPNCGADMRGET